MKAKIPTYFRKFGFELEFSSKFDDVKGKARAIISKIYGKNKFKTEDDAFMAHTSFTKWIFKLDASTGCELTTPISRFNDFKKIEKVLGKLKELRLKITHSDSVHVHMQANDVPKHNIIAAWLQIEKGIMKCFPIHRRNNVTYCHKLIHGKKYKKIADFFIDAEDESGAHHSILNLYYYDERKTIEFRLMEGNTNINLVRPWVKFCMLFLNYAKNIDPVKIICEKEKLKTTTKDIIELMNIEDSEVIAFLVERGKI